MFTLRPLKTKDIPLVASWLYAEHVQPWFEHPEDWLHELHNRHGAYNFITHLIAEADSVPVGFCQYYDCYFAKEEWYEANEPGKVFSIDYLVGNPEYLKQGYGRAMVSHMLDMLQALGAKYVVVLPDEANIASRRALEACGFVWEGFYTRFL